MNGGAEHPSRIWPAILCLSACLAAQPGCACEFLAYRAIQEDDGRIRIQDPKPIPLPSSAPKSIGVYWKTRRSGTDPVPPAPYEVIGIVQGAAGFLWQSRWALDANYRRAAAALGGDAVVDAWLGVFTGPYPANEVHGRIVKWKQPTTTSRPAGDK